MSGPRADDPAAGPSAGDPSADDPLAGPALPDPDDAWANAPYIPDAGGFLARWPRDAAAFRDAMRAAGRAREDLAYGEHPRERLDVFLPDGAGSARGVAVIVHGGYWMRFDRKTFSHLAAGAVARGWAAAVPGYPLCPEVGIGRIERAVRAAVEFAAGLAPGPVRLAGHSAGGQLVARMACADAGPDPAVADRIDAVLAVSGVHDLVPLLGTALNDTLGLDLAEARRRSPARSAPRPGPRVVAAVGADERPEFLRQNGLLGLGWGAAASVRERVEPGRHHFDVIEALEDPGSALLDAWLGDVRPGA